MGQTLSMLFTDEIGFREYRRIETKYLNLTSIKIQPGGELIAAANETGTLLLYDTISTSTLPQQYRFLNYESGGVTELLWINADILAVGTTRGKIIIFSLKNPLRSLIQITAVQAHGDGATQVAVQAMEFSKVSKRLVSVGQCVHGICLWDVAEDGMLTVCNIGSPIMYLEPRFVAFGPSDTLIIGFVDNALIEKYVVEDGRHRATSNHPLNQIEGAPDERRLGNALFLEDATRLIIFNLFDGIDVYDSNTFRHEGKGSFKINHCSSQGISAFRQGTYVMALAKNGYVNAHKVQDAAYVTRYKVSKHDIQAIHSLSINPNQEIFVALSCKDASKPSSIAIWMRKDNVRRANANGSAPRSEDYSSLQMIILCLVVCIIFQTMSSLVPIMYQQPLMTVPSVTKSGFRGLIEYVKQRVY